MRKDKLLENQLNVIFKNMKMDKKCFNIYMYIHTVYT